MDSNDLSRKRRKDSEVEEGQSQADTEESANDRQEFNLFTQSVGLHQKEKDLNLQNAAFEVSHREKELDLQKRAFELEKQQKEAALHVQATGLDLQKQRDELAQQTKERAFELEKERHAFELAQEKKDLKERENQLRAQAPEIQPPQDGIHSAAAGPRQSGGGKMEEEEDDSEEDSSVDESNPKKDTTLPNTVDKSNDDGVAAVDEIKPINLPMNLRMPVEIEPAFNELSVQTTYAAIKLPMNFRMPVEIEPAFNELSVQTMYAAINLPMNLRMPVEIEPAFNELSVQTIYSNIKLPMNLRMPVEIEPAFNELSVQTIYSNIKLPMNLRMPVEIEPAFNELSVQTIYSNIKLPMNLRMPVEIEPAFSELSVQTIYSNIKLPMNLRMPVEIEPAFSELSVQTASTYIKLPMNLRMPCSELYAFSELVVNGQSRNKSIVIHQKWLKQYDDIVSGNAAVVFKLNTFHVKVNQSLKEKCVQYTKKHQFINNDKFESTAAIILQGSHFPYCPPFAPLLQNSFLEKYNQEFKHYQLTERQCTSIKVTTLDLDVQAFISRNVGNITTVQLPQNIKISIQSQDNTICIQDAMDKTLPAIVVKHCKLFFTYLLTHCLTNTLTPLSKFNSLAKKENPEFLHRLQLYSQTST